jgi:hypothetical protein
MRTLIPGGLSSHFAEPPRHSRSAGLGPKPETLRAYDYIFSEIAGLEREYVSRHYETIKRENRAHDQVNSFASRGCLGGGIDLKTKE